MKKEKMKRKDPWKGIPDELKLMCLVEIRSINSGYCTLPMLKFLIDNMNNYDSYYYNTTPYDVLYWIDTGIEACLFPLEQYEDKWVEYKEEIMKVLTHADMLLKKYAPSDYATGHRMEFDDDEQINVIKFKQKINVYFCVLYMYMEDWDRLEARLSELLADSRRNASYLLSCAEAEKLACEDDWSGYHWRGASDKWEVVNWLMKEYLPVGKARKIFARGYETYVAYLSDLYTKDKSEACRHMLFRAEKYLNRLCEYILDEIDDNLSDFIDEDDEEPNYSDEGYTELTADMEEFEKKYQESWDRIKGLEPAAPQDGNKEE